MRHRAFVVLVLLSGLSACTGSPPPAAPPPKPVAAPQPPQPPAIAQAVPQVPTPVAPSYSPKGRRDPFETLDVREGAGGVTVSSARLTGIVRGARSTLALIETSDGVGYILKPGDTLGDGRLIEIGPNTAVFATTAKGGSTSRVVLTLATD